jgi:PAS domain S-box-containing protein
VTFEEAPIGIGHAELNGPWLRVNARLAAILGRSPEEVRASSLMDMVHEEDRAALEENLRHVIAGEESRHKGEYRLKKRDGSVVWTSLTFSLIRDLEGRPLQLAIIEDLSEEKRLALALEASERRFARLRESGLLGIFHERPDGVTESANDAFLAMVGYTREEVEDGKLRSAIFTGDPADVAEAKARELLRFTGVCPPFEHEFVRRDGRRGVMFVGGVANGGAIGFAVDVTAIREAEQARVRNVRELEDAVRARADFLMLASHELRTPLTPLLLEVGSLKSTLETSTGPVDGHLLVRKVDAIDRYVRRAEALVSSMLEFSELSMGQIVLEREDTDLVALAHGVLARSARELARAGCVATIEGDASVRGSFDRVHIEHVVEKLLSNAIKYAPGRPIEISIRGAEAEARLTVCDHGPGIDREQHAKIFDRFARLTAIQHHGGLGLGLWTARELARAHGGSLVVESEPGSGACFHLTLPLDGKPKGDASPRRAG